MLKIKIKTLGIDEDGDIINKIKAKERKSNLCEHIAAIDYCVKMIVENKEEIAIDKLCEIIKYNYIAYKEVNKDE